MSNETPVERWIAYRDAIGCEGIAEVVTAGFERAQPIAKRLVQKERSERKTPSASVTKRERRLRKRRTSGCDKAPRPQRAWIKSSG